MERMRFGLRLALARENRRLTQEELAKKSGVSRQTIIRIETGKCDGVRTETLVKLAKALKVSPNYFLRA